MGIRISLFLLYMAYASLQAQELEIRFAINNAGIPVEGTFRSSSIQYMFDRQQPESTFFRAEVDVASIDTGIKARDRHLLKPKYFDAGNYPKMTFKSTKVYKQGADYVLEGELNIKNTIRPITTPLLISHGDGGQKEFSVSFVLNRRDFGVGGNHLILGDEVRVSIKLRN